MFTRCHLPAVHVLMEYPPAHFAFPGKAWAVSEVESTLDPREQMTWDLFVTDGEVEPDKIRDLIATQRDITWLANHANRMGLVTAFMLLAFGVVLLLANYL